MLAAVALAAALLYLPGLSTLDLWAPDEPRYAAIAEELRSGRHGAAGLVLLHLNDQPYDQKPPLYFWLAALIGLVPGRVDELAARLPSALAGVASVAGTFALARRLRLGRGEALLAAGLLATSVRFAFSARRAQLDVLLCALELAAVFLFVVLEGRPGGAERARRHPWLLAGLHAAVGAAALAKGPVGWLPLLVLAVHLVGSERRAALRALFPIWSWSLSLGPVLLWAAGATALGPEGFAHGAIATNLFERFFSGSSHARPFYYYAYQLPLDFLPWSLLWPLALPALMRGRRDEPMPLLARWTLVPLLFFTLSAGKRGLYLLPIYPALAIATAAGLARLPRRALAVAIACVGSLELAAAQLVLPRLDGEKSPRPIALAIARRSTPSEVVGIVGMRPLEGAIPYYGGRRVASLEDPQAARAFVAQGGRLLLVRTSELEHLSAVVPIEVVERFRSGRRALTLAQSTQGKADAATPRPELSPGSP